MADFGTKVSKAGFPVESASDENLIFSSKLNQFKVKVTGTATITAVGSTDIAHGLAYNPIFFGLFSRNNTQFKMGYAGVDATNLRLTSKGFAGDDTYWRYYIFYHTGV